MKLKEIARLIGSKTVGDPDIEITGVSSIKDAKKGDITFFSDRKNIADVYKTEASAVILKEKIKDLKATMLIVEDPRYGFAKTLEIFYKKQFQPLGISKEASIGKNVKFGKDVSVYPQTFIRSNVSVGDRSVIFPCVYIGKNVSIGEDSIIHPNVTIRENVKIGKRVVIHSGSVIGSDGFGYAQSGDKQGHYKIPQVGGVLIEDDVEIGANVTVDRATIGYTVIGSGTKIDNLAQIAHNVKIGKNCLIMAQVGVGGSVEMGNGVILAGQAGIRDHVKLGNGVMVGAQSGIGHDISDHGIFSGSPAIPHKIWLRAQGIYSKLPEIVKRLQRLERKSLPVGNKTSNRVKKEK